MRNFRVPNRHSRDRTPEEEREVRLRSLRDALDRVDRPAFSYDQIATAACAEGCFITAKRVAALHEALREANPATLSSITPKESDAVDWAIARWEFTQAMEAYKRRVGDTFPTHIRWFPDFSTPSGMREVANHTLPMIATAIEHVQCLERERESPTTPS